MSLFDSYAMVGGFMAEKLLDRCLSAAAHIPQQLHTRRASTSSGRGGRMEPLSSAIAHAAEGGLGAASSSAASAADLNSPADNTGQMQI